jgi:hypothetical protein
MHFFRNEILNTYLLLNSNYSLLGGRRGRDHMVVEFTSGNENKKSRIFGKRFLNIYP